VRLGRPVLPRVCRALGPFRPLAQRGDLLLLLPLRGPQLRHLVHQPPQLGGLCPTSSRHVIRHV
jgi:hypothetical protein